MMDRAEAQLRRSPFVLRDEKLRAYVQDITCRLASQHCPDVRVHLVRTPYFNASMAPNGMMQVWTGLMLRVDNEAQLAAVLGHEIGHYLARHSLERMRDVRSRSTVGQFLGLLGPVGLLGQLGVVASMYAYGRDHEREADRIGAALMGEAGYDVAEAAKVWQNLLLEIRARPGGAGESANPLFATHPAAEDRQEALALLAREHPGGATNEGAWRAAVTPYLREWLNEEIKRGQHEESVALLGRLIDRSPTQPEYRFARGEAYRLRGGDADLDAAVEDFRAAIAAGGEPPQTHRGLGMIYRSRKDPAAARASFERYIELAPDAADAAMIRSYIQEPGS